MKKFLSTLLVACLCCGILAACSSQKKEPTAVNDDSAVDETVAQEGESEEADDTEISEKTPEEEAALEKEQQESLITYAEMIEEIQNDIPELTVNYVVSGDDGRDTMSISMPLLESKDATYYKMAELTATKETLMNNNGIDDITIFVYNGEENVGIVMFANEDGEFKPTVNTL